METPSDFRCAQSSLANDYFAELSRFLGVASQTAQTLGAYLMLMMALLSGVCCSLVVVG